MQLSLIFPPTPMSHGSLRSRNQKAATTHQFHCHKLKQLITEFTTEQPNSHTNITPQTSPTHNSPPKASSTPNANTCPQTHVHSHKTISPTRETAPISSYMGLLSDQVDRPRDSLANVLGGAIRKWYDVDEPQRLNRNFAAKPLPEYAVYS